MDAKQAKAHTYVVAPPVMPPKEVMDAIHDATLLGLRKAPVNTSITEQNEWWLKDNGYILVTVDSPNPTGREICVEVRW